MKYWLQKEGIDGFRCDVAGNVPTDFWQKTIPELRAVKNIFMLAEAWEPELLKDNLFDMAYAWDGHHTSNKIAQGKENVSAWDKYMIEKSKKYEARGAPQKDWRARTRVLANEQSCAKRAGQKA